MRAGSPSLAAARRTLPMDGRERYSGFGIRNTGESDAMSAPTFDLYKLLVEEVREARKARRDLANVFTTLNLAGIGALGFLAGPESGQSAGLLIWAVVALVLCCIVWRASNAYYTAMLGSKYTIIYEIEKDLGIDALQREWRQLPRHGMIRFFSLERAMPVLFGVGYIVFIAYQVTPADVIAIFNNALRPFLLLSAGVRN